MIDEVVWAYRIESVKPFTMRPKNTAQNERYVSGIFDNEKKCEQ